MLRSLRRQPLGHLADLNITPLLDLCFVLLVIFMITAPLLGNKNIDLVLPTSEAGPATIPQSNYHIVIIDNAGQLYLDRQPIDSAALSARLEELRAGYASREEPIAVIIEADARIPVAEVVPVFDLLTDAGIVHTALVSRPGT